MSEREIEMILSRLDDPDHGLVAICVNQKWIKEGLMANSAILATLSGEGLARCKQHDKDIAAINRAMKTRNPNPPQDDDNGGFEIETPSGWKGKTHGVWGMITAVLLAIIVWMFCYNSRRASTNATASQISRDDIARVVLQQMRQISRDSKENKEQVQDIKEQTR